MNFGDEVKVTLEPTDGFTFLIVGTMTYAERDEQVLVANPNCIGMPINVEWLEPTGDGNADLAKELRERYVAQFGDRLKPIIETGPMP